ncbi:MAG TPA: hypothetical protein DDZ55_10400 [Firmicutes bacterium]|nr:hypothetical protein [Bacillota bacterium]
MRKKQATLKDIAVLAEASVATVSWVLNGNSRKYVSEQLRERVLKAAKDLNYQPNPLAQRLKGKSRKLLAVVVPQFENVFFNHIVIGAEKYANSQGYRLLICSTDDHPQKEWELVNQLIATWVDGILIAPTYSGEDAVKSILGAGIPLVLLDRRVGKNIDYIGMDNFQIAYTGTKYLLEQKHRRIGYIGWESPLHTMLARNQGFLKAVEELGVSRDEIQIRKCARNPESSYPLTKELLADFKPTAFYIDQNTIADGVVKAIRDAKLRIPKDISVLIHGEPTWAVMNIPEFTCIALPDFEIGSEGAKLLIAKLEGASHKPKEIYLSGEIVERASVRKLS